KRIGIHRDQEQSFLAGKMPGKGSLELRGRRKMDEAIAQIVRTPAIGALSLGFTPGRCRTDLIDHRQGANVFLFLGCRRRGHPRPAKASDGSVVATQLQARTWAREPASTVHAARDCRGAACKVIFLWP